MGVAGVTGRPRSDPSPLLDPPSLRLVSLMFDVVNCRLSCSFSFGLVFL